MTAVVQQRWVY